MGEVREKEGETDTMMREREIETEIEESVETELVRETTLVVCRAETLTILERQKRERGTSSTEILEICREICREIREIWTETSTTVPTGSTSIMTGEREISQTGETGEMTTAVVVEMIDGETAGIITLSP